MQLAGLRIVCVWVIFNDQVREQGSQRKGERRRGRFRWRGREKGKERKGKERDVGKECVSPKYTPLLM